MFHNLSWILSFLVLRTSWTRRFHVAHSLKWELFSIAMKNQDSNPLAFLNCVNEFHSLILLVQKIRFHFLPSFNLLPDHLMQQQLFLYSSLFLSTISCHRCCLLSRDLYIVYRSNFQTSLIPQHQGILELFKI